MPLIHIHVIEGRRNADEMRRVCDVIQEIMLRHFAAPEEDRYQLVTAHPTGSIVIGDSGLGIARTDDVIVVEITEEGRSREQKVDMYRAMARSLS